MNQYFSIVKKVCGKIQDVVAISESEERARKFARDNKLDVVRINHNRYMWYSISMKPEQIL